MSLLDGALGQHIGRPTNPMHLRRVFFAAGRQVTKQQMRASKQPVTRNSVRHNRASRRAQFFAQLAFRHHAHMGGVIVKIQREIEAAERVRSREVSDADAGVSEINRPPVSTPRTISRNSRSTPVKCSPRAMQVTAPIDGIGPRQADLVRNPPAENHSPAAPAAVPPRDPPAQSASRDQFRHVDWSVSPSEQPKSATVLPRTTLLAYVTRRPRVQPRPRTRNRQFQ